MAKFKITKENFLKFLLKTSCNGVIKFRESKAITEPLFSCFYLDVKGDKLEVLTIDTVRKKIQMNTSISGIEVIEEGIITITDFRAIVDVLKSRGLDKGILTVWDEGNKIYIESDKSKDGYEIRQRENKDITIFTAKKGRILKYLDSWRKNHNFEIEEKEIEVDGRTVKLKEEGLLILTFMDRKTKEVELIPFPTKLEVSKNDLLKVVSDTINLTKDNTTVLTLEDGVLKAFKGEGNARTKGKHVIDYKDLGTDLIEFDESFYSIQTIIPNLFDKIILNIRRVNTDGSLAVFIKSVDEKSKIEINIGITSKKE